MEKYFGILITLTLCTACSVKRNQPISDYITQYVINDTVKDHFYGGKKRDSVVWIGKKKRSKKRALNIVKYSSHYNEKSGSWDLNFKETPIYNDDAWKVLIKENINDTIADYWHQKDFSFKNRIFIQHEIDSIRRVNDYLKREKVYYFTDVMYYHEKKYAVFEVIVASNLFAVGAFNDELIFMKKEKGKWVLAGKAVNDPFRNP